MSDFLVIVSATGDSENTAAQMIHFAFSHAINPSCGVQAWTDALEINESLLEAMCRAHDAEEAAQKGEPTPWREDIAGNDAEWRAERICAMRCALRAVGLV